MKAPNCSANCVAMEALERIGTKNAQGALKRLAGGRPEAMLTREAQSSLLMRNHCCGQIEELLNNIDDCVEAQNCCFTQTLAEYATVA